MNKIIPKSFTPWWGWINHKRIQERYVPRFLMKSKRLIWNLRPLLNIFLAVASFSIISWMCSRTGRIVALCSIQIFHNFTNSWQLDSRTIRCRLSLTASWTPSQHAYWWIPLCFGMSKLSFTLCAHNSSTDAHRIAIKISIYIRLSKPGSGGFHPSVLLAERRCYICWTALTWSCIVSLVQWHASHNINKGNHQNNVHIW